MHNIFYSFYHIANNVGKILLLLKIKTSTVYSIIIVNTLIVHTIYKLNYKNEICSTTITDVNHYIYETFKSTRVGCVESMIIKSF